jgi:hypothetical protein
MPKFPHHGNLPRVLHPGPKVLLTAFGERTKYPIEVFDHQNQHLAIQRVGHGCFWTRRQHSPSGTGLPSAEPGQHLVQDVEVAGDAHCVLVEANESQPLSDLRPLLRSMNGHIEQMGLSRATRPDQEAVGTVSRRRGTDQPINQDVEDLLPSDCAI